MVLADNLTLVAAVCGVLLGVLNTMKLYFDDRPRLKVLVNPIVATLGSQLSHYKISATIRNLSKFPMTVEGTNFINNNREQLIPQDYRVYYRGELNSFPIELPPRTSLLILYPNPNDEAPSAGFDRVIVRTQCGHTASGTCRILRET